MSPSPNAEANGTAIATANGNFMVQAATPDGHAVNAQGTYNPNTNAWNSIPAKIEYNDQAELTGKHSFSGTVGPTSFKFTCDNGAIITGPVNPPVVPTMDVMGTVNWVLTM
ncbi:unnamed protein product [Rhizoctonia solani]|uniref:Uncharacterized protein n=1 Tax=Rhizoctonia solani TaxID=456999 RepID=A0A8H3HT89_9AGAM|nr:unnamed protein product [Rhizoctonia solani]